MLHMTDSVTMYSIDVLSDCFTIKNKAEKQNIYETKQVITVENNE